MNVTTAVTTDVNKDLLHVHDDVVDLNAVHGAEGTERQTNQKR